MNSFEPCFWMGALLVVLRLADGSASPRAWLSFGLLAGLGIENKHSTVFFLIALLLGLILSPQRRIPLALVRRRSRPADSAGAA
jgi:4-amino-4-deoxy-L-arabinose transferase-like glycosyltransferase